VAYRIKKENYQDGRTWRLIHIIDRGRDKSPAGLVVTKKQFLLSSTSGTVSILHGPLKKRESGRRNCNLRRTSLAKRSGDFALRSA
jgi:hypothetical protein